MIDKRRFPVYAVAAFTFLSFFLVPSRVASLRRRLERRAPEQWAAVTNNGPFRSVSPYEDLGYSDEGLYAARVRQTALHGLPYGPWSGHRTFRSWLFDSLMFYPVAAFVWICGGDLTYGWVLARAALGTCWFLMILLILRAYSREEKCSLVAGTFAFFFLDTLRETVGLLFHLFQDPSTMVSRVKYVPGTLFLPISLFLRMPVPSVGLLWLAAGIAAAVGLGLSSRRRLFGSIAVGLFCGLLCLVHFFDWVSCVLALFLLAAAMRMDRASSAAGRANLSTAAATAAVVSAAYYLLAKSLTEDLMRDLIDRSGTWGRHFSPVSIPIMLLALLFWALGRRREGAQRWFWYSAAALEAAAALLANLSLALGYDLMFPDHAVHPAAFMAILALMCWGLERAAVVRRLAPQALTVTAFICCWSVFRSKAWADLHYKLYGIPQDVAAASRWLDDHAPKDSTLASISAPLTWLLPSELEMRFPVTVANPVCGEPVRTDDNLRAFASVLTTLDVDVARMGDERWRHAAEINVARGEIENLTGNTDWDAMERSLWPFFLIDVAPWRAGALQTAWARIETYAREARPLPRPFYAWIQERDAALLRRPPETLGGRLVYRNASVKLFLFPKAD